MIAKMSNNDKKAVYTEKQNGIVMRGGSLTSNELSEVTSQCIVRRNQGKEQTIPVISSLLSANFFWYKFYVRCFGVER